MHPALPFHHRDCCSRFAWHAGLPERGPLRWLACHGGGGGKSTSGNTSQTSSTEQVGVSDQAQGVMAKAGDNSQLSVMLQDLSPEVIAQIADFASGVVNGSLSTNAQTTQAVLKADQETLSAVTAANARLTESTLDRITDLAKSTSTGGMADANKNLLYLGLAAAAALGGVAIFARKGH